jgi:ParB/RepB/Spo0J family partition protein
MSTHTMNVQNIPVAKISDNPTNARQSFDTESIEALADDIKINGLLNPLTVMPGEGGRYVIKTGSRRFRAVKLLGWTEVPANIRGADGANPDLISLAENEDRQALSPYEAACAYKRVQDAYKLTGAAIAKAIGKNKNTVNNRIRLLEGLAPKLLAAWKGDGFDDEGNRKRHPLATENNLMQFVTIKDPKEQTKAWEKFVSGDSDEDEDDEGGESAPKRGGPKAPSAKKQAQTLLAILAKMPDKERDKVPALAAVKYVLGQQKTVPGLKLS